MAASAIGSMEKGGYGDVTMTLMITTFSRVKSTFFPAVASGLRALLIV